MKKAYNAPKLSVHGNVEEITQAFGPAQTQDFYVVGGSTVQPIGPSQIAGHGTGSANGIITPLG